MRRSGRSTVLTGAVVLALAGCGGDDGVLVEGSTAPGEVGAAARAVLRDAEGSEVGSVHFSRVAAGTEVVTEVQGLEPGFHGLHVHGTGLCEPDSAAPGAPGRTGAFLSAGGHLGSDEGVHPDHHGDLPSLYVTARGTGFLSTVTDRFEVDDLVADEDGSAVVVHSGPDNFANVPGRYAPGGPDEDTLAAGDAGPRLACGVVE